MFTRALRARRAIRIVVPHSTPPLRYITLSTINRAPQTALDINQEPNTLPSLPPRTETTELSPSSSVPKTFLPTPLPNDVRPSNAHISLFPTQDSHESLALVDLCLQKPETTDRAYSIFAGLVKDHLEGRGSVPDSAAWGSVIEGAGAMAAEYIHSGSGKEFTSPSDIKGKAKATSLDDEPTATSKKMAMWRKRAENLVQRWEEIALREREKEALEYYGEEIDYQTPLRGSHEMKDAVLRRSGNKIYQGWLRGCLHSKTDLSSFLFTMDSLSLPYSILLPAFNAEEKPIMFNALISTAVRLGRADILTSLENLQRSDSADWERKKQVADTIRLEEENKVPRVKAVPATAPFTAEYNKRSLENRQGDAEQDEGPARFAIINLRATLRELRGSRDQDPVRRQQLLEAASLSAAKAELEHAAQMVKDRNLQSVEDAKKLGSTRIQAWMHDWSLELTKRLEKDIRAMQNQAGKVKSKPDPTRALNLQSRSSPRTKPADLILYLQLLPTDKLALITILEITRLAGSSGIPDGMKTLRALLTVGKAIETEYRAGALRDVIGAGSKSWLGQLSESGGGGGGGESVSGRQLDYIWNRLGSIIKDEPSAPEPDEPSLIVDPERSQGMLDAMKAVWTPTWSQGTHLAIGSMLVNALLETAKVTRKITDDEGEIHTESQPAFVHGYEYFHGHKLGIITLNREVARRMSNDSIGVVLHPKHLPMLVKPRQWTAHDSGGYLFHKVSAMRFKDSPEQSVYLVKASEEGHLDGVFAGLDVLSQTAWRINHDVFNVMLEAWNAGVAIADIPGSADNNDYKLPKKTGDGPEARAQYVSAMRDYTGQIRKDHAERCKFNYNLEIARAYLYDEFYIPHNMDFRGRAYPIPPHLSPVGDDLSRGLLTFADKKPLGKRGLMWLRIHLANVCGFDKASFSEREAYAVQHEQDILDSADKPLAGIRWWLKAEDPWQCLATCFEIANALRSPDPHAYECSLPVHQDGTCNGMQHYAALGGDPAGALAVNLDGGDRPSDVYTNIADLVNEIIDRDAKRGLPLALKLQGRVGRKVVKQTVMTTVYGVTFIGAKDQIAKQLRDRGDISRDDLFAASGYLAKTVLHCISSLFGGAKAIQDWLTVCARMISHSFQEERVRHSQDPLMSNMGHFKHTRPVMSETGVAMSRAKKEMMSAVIWTTPLGLPVVQPYRKKVQKQTMTALQSVYISDPNAIAEVITQKQASGMPPNFIHSLDATHMLMTAVRCRKDGIRFASVHDSYWSHASDIDGMSGHIREAFIELHSRDIIGDLRKEFVERYADNWLSRTTAQKTTSVFLEKFPDLKPPGLNRIYRDVKSAEPDEDEVDPLDAAFDDSATAGDSTERPENNDKPSPAIKLNGKAYSRLAECLPECPPRGAFDVNQIRLSPYFFS